MNLKDLYEAKMASVEKTASVNEPTNELVKQASEEVEGLKKLAGELFVIGQDFARSTNGLPKLAEEMAAKKEEAKEEKAEVKKEETKEETKEDKDAADEGKEENLKEVIKDEMKKNAAYREALINKYYE